MERRAGIKPRNLNQTRFVAKELAVFPMQFVALILYMIRVEDEVRSAVRFTRDRIPLAYSECKLPHLLAVFLKKTFAFQNSLRFTDGLTCSRARSTFRAESVIPTDEFRPFSRSFRLSFHGNSAGRMCADLWTDIVWGTSRRRCLYRTVHFEIKNDGYNVWCSTE